MIWADFELLLDIYPIKKFHHELGKPYGVRMEAVAVVDKKKCPVAIWEADCLLVRGIVEGKLRVHKLGWIPGIAPGFTASRAVDFAG